MNGTMLLWNVFLFKKKKKVKYNSGCLVYDPFLLQDAAFVCSLESGLKGFLAFIYRSF